MTNKKKPRRIYNCFKCKDRNWLIECRCGHCNDLIPLCDRYKRVNRFKYGHQLRGEKDSSYNYLSLKNIFKGLYKRCQCGCNYLIPIINKLGKFAKYKGGHNAKFIKRIIRRGKDAPNYKGGVVKDKEYTRTLVRDHPFCSSTGYVRTHRLALEAHYSEIYGMPIFILPYFDVHHRDGDTKNNDWRNLEMIHRRAHTKIHKPFKDRSGTFCSYPDCKNPNRTFTTKKGYEHWYIYKDGWMCNVCYMKDWKLKKKVSYNQLTLLSFFSTSYL